MHIPMTEDDDYRLRKFKRLFFRDGNQWEAKEGTIRGLIAIESSPLTWFCYLHLHVGGYRPVVLPCTYYCFRKDCDGENPGHALPVAAHVDRRHITFLRKKKLGMPMGLRDNLPAFTLVKLKLKRLSPTESLHDPYLVALLLALGQRQWRMLGQEQTRQAAGVTPKVLFSSEDHDHLYLYSAKISSSLLSMFDDPATAPSAPDSLPIQITSIPYKPHETLRGRLLALLLSATSPLDVDKAENLIVYT
ncbi:uncharacterized protein HRG_04379 [Hirsutella rhossiliensis]|uniref:Uncharacterized protein n=1 Tax=Hirsutella rhossiliensis TaxID=111463 RepID=A0A9P8SKB0_9HYPO|nr:uncharacterized protein HRG_04379 [Hirsutella rhossiliensis]KAH0963951.1 hypothetical protein HRG_04379 [Hirsutella rhossiliensis]